MKYPRTLIASAIMILTALGLGPISRVEDVPIKKPLSQFPMQIGEWKGFEDRFEERIYKILGVDDSILANYRSQDGHQISLYVGFYQNQREGNVIHSPKHCMPGAGWNITHTAVEEVALAQTNPEKLNVTKLKMEKDGQKIIAFYWFQSRGRFIHSEYLQKIFLVYDSMFKNRTDGSFVRLIATVKDDNEKATLNNLKEFIGLLIPLLNEHLPS